MHIYYKFSAAECKWQSSLDVFVRIIKTKENQLNNQNTNCAAYNVMKLEILQSFKAVIRQEIGNLQVVDSV